eukprot:10042275-Lingulodinium_polyedra.AAC.1
MGSPGRRRSAPRAVLRRMDLGSRDRGQPWGQKRRPRDKDPAPDDSDVRGALTHCGRGWRPRA